MCVTVISLLVVFSLSSACCPVFYSSRPGNYDLTDKFLGGTTARKCGFPKGDAQCILRMMNLYVKNVDSVTDAESTIYKSETSSK